MASAALVMVMETSDDPRAGWDLKGQLVQPPAETEDLLLLIHPRQIHPNPAQPSLFVKPPR